VKICVAVALASALFMIIQVSTTPGPQFTMFVASAAVVNAGSLAAWRWGSRTLFEHRLANRRSLRHALIIGGGPLGRSVAASIESSASLNTIVKGFIDDRVAASPKQTLGKLEDFLAVSFAEYIDDIYVTLPLTRCGIAEIIDRARERHMSVKFVPPDIEVHPTTVHYIGTHPAFTIHEEPIRGGAKFFKRLADVLLALLLLIVAMPLMMFIAIVIKLDSPGPAFYCADRVGYKGRHFRFYKFRTMVHNADELKDKLRQFNERKGPFFKITNDPRLTRSGKYLRITSLDELPQIFNVLKGDMSLVGPRPHPLDDYRQYRLEDRRRLDVLPGITGLWQVVARTDPSFERAMELDIEYIENWNFWLDLKILAKTLPVVIRRQAA
jgi:exopolysaccharide biosynthesis polyprenyl glycosylphosphotransferase